MRMGIGSSLVICNSIFFKQNVSVFRVCIAINHHFNNWFCYFIIICLHGRLKYYKRCFSVSFTQTRLINLYSF